jgi:hypothetical protein
MCQRAVWGPTDRLDVQEKGKFSLPCLETNYYFSVVQPVAVVFVGCPAKRSVSAA